MRFSTLNLWVSCLLRLEEVFAGGWPFVAILSGDAVVIVRW
jgi:hypothetical protein